MPSVRAMKKTLKMLLRKLRWPLRIGGALLALVFLFVIVVIADGWQAIGKAPIGELRARMEASPQWGGRVFVNPQPMWNGISAMIRDSMSASEEATPADFVIPVDRGALERWASPPESGLRVTWLGHSTTWIELDGVTLLTDPVWGERTAPVDWLGPERWYSAPVALADMPVPDAVLISHDHYDHLDTPTILEIAQWDTVFIVPLGVAAHLAYWGVPDERIRSLDWGDSVMIGNIEVVCTESRHASGRQLLDQNRTLWASYTLVGPEHRVFFSGDTGLFPGLRDIAEQYGPFDLTMFEVGAYSPAWPDWHIGPEQAVIGHEWVQGSAGADHGVLLPIHWGLFDLAAHSWVAPAERTWASAALAGVTAVFPRPGGSFEPASPPAPERWWDTTVTWRDANAHPVVSRGIEGYPPAAE
ncbi:MAG: L-ascorbate metabolism protein UlaG (beta-lactamase superfamily) [Bradymonadia bacterium]|jgi:L-ascorbate metabolism protein UlaG (beta-lactamase superfamily)